MLISEARQPCVYYKRKHIKTHEIRLVICFETLLAGPHWLKHKWIYISRTGEWRCPEETGELLLKSTIICLVILNIWSGSLVSDNIFIIRYRLHFLKSQSWNVLQVHINLCHIYYLHCVANSALWGALQFETALNSIVLQVKHERWNILFLSLKLCWNQP